MLGMDAIFENPTIMRMIAAKAGIEAARLDFDKARGILLASVRAHGQITQHEIPLGKTFTTAEILKLMFGPKPAAHVATSDPPPKKQPQTR